MRAVVRFRGVALSLLLIALLLSSGCGQRVQVSDSDQKACRTIIEARLAADDDDVVKARVDEAVTEWVLDCMAGWMFLARPYRSFPFIEGRLANASDPGMQLLAARVTLRRGHELKRQFQSIRRMLHVALEEGMVLERDYTDLRYWMKERQLKNAATIRAARAVLKQRRYVS